MRRGEETWVPSGERRKMVERRRGSVSVVIGYSTHSNSILKLSGISFIVHPRPLLPSTVYWIGVRAHNELGASDQATMLVKTRAVGPDDIEEEVWVGDKGDKVDPISTAEFPLVPVLVAAVTAAGLILLCLIDIACCCLWDRGVAHMLCGGRCCANASQPKREQEVQKQDVLNLTTGGDPRLATVKGGRRTLERRQQRAAHEGLYDAPEHWGYNAQQESLLPGNLYEATPDHSILKNGLAKSLSRVDIADIAVSAPLLRVRMANQSSRRRTPGSSRQTPVSRKARARKSQQDPHQVHIPSILTPRIRDSSCSCCSVTEKFTANTLSNG